MTEICKTHLMSGRTGRASMRVCIIGAPGSSGRYMLQHALDRGVERGHSLSA